MPDKDTRKPTVPALPPPPGTPPDAAPTTLWGRVRGWPIGVPVVVALLAVVVLVRPFTGGASDTTEVAPGLEEPRQGVADEDRPTSPPTTSAPGPPATDAPDGVPDGAQAGVVERVVDGDTIAVRVDEHGGPLLANATHTIRLLVIDTPETTHPQRGVECWGPEASAFTAEHLAVGSTVYLVADAEDTDRYGRFLRYVWTADGVFFNEQAVGEGFARAVVYMPNDARFAQVQAAEEDARSARRGMWGPPCHYDAAVPRAPAPAPAPGPQPEPEQSTASYANCSEARAAGAAPLHRSDPGYGPHLDRDNDGIGCE